MNGITGLSVEPDTCMFQLMKYWDSKVQKYILYTYEFIDIKLIKGNQ